MLNFYSFFIIALISAWGLNWNMFAESQAPEFSSIGYGDWCVPSEGAHPGLDFPDPSPYSRITNVLSPSTETTYVIAVHGSGTGWMIVLGLAPSDTSGWQMAHLEPFDPGNLWEIGDTIQSKQPIGFVWDPSMGPGAPTYWFNHVHLMWLQQAIPPHSNGYLNPFDYLTPPAGYDSLKFRPVPFYESFAEQSRGILFDKQDEHKSLDESGDVHHWHGGSILDFRMFQDEVYEFVDFIVSPTSVDCIPPIADSVAGVRRLEVEIMKQDDEGNFSLPTFYTKRTVFDFTGEIPYSDPPEYYDLFFDPPDPRDGDWIWHFNTSYIASNSGNYTGPFNTAYDNIWTSTSASDIHNWSSEEYNRGCWDTRMRHPDSYQSGYPDQAFVPENAAFPDGRYAVEVTATTHGGATDCILLPKDKILAPESSTAGVLVNNFYPHITQVDVTSNDEPFYTCHYSTPNPANPRNSERTCFTDYFGRVQGYPLEVNVQFSEPVTISTAFIEAVVGDNVNWQSGLVSATDERQLTDENFSLVTILTPPDYYLGKLRLHIEAHDLSLAEHELDSDPITIPFPHSFNVSKDQNYEPGKAVFEWNVAEWITSASVKLGYKEFNDPELIFQCDLAWTLQDYFGNDCRLAWNTLGPDEAPYESKGICERYSGFWARSRWYFDYIDSYRNVYLVYPDLTGYCGWGYHQFTMPMLYQQNFNTNPHSCFTDFHPITTYSNGDYCFVSWRDTHADGTSNKYIACISAISLQYRILQIPANAGYIWPAAYDMIRYPVGTIITFLTPYSPCFFPEENPNQMNIATECNLNASDQINEINADHLQISMNNPLRRGESIQIALGEGSRVSTSVNAFLYDLSGRVVQSIAGTLSSSQNVFEISTLNIPTGVYWLHLVIDSYEETRKVVVID